MNWGGKNAHQADGQVWLWWHFIWQCIPVTPADTEVVSLSSLSLFWPCIYWKWKESEVAQSCPTLCDPMDCSLPGSSVHGIFQARVLEWIAISFSRGSSQPRDWTRVSHIIDRRFTIWAYWWSPNPPVTINYLLDFILFPLFKLIPSSGFGPSLWLHRGI